MVMIISTLKSSTQPLQWTELPDSQHAHSQITNELMVDAIFDADELPWEAKHIYKLNSNHGGDNKIIANIQNEI
jgi:hypothetical protein